MDIFIDGKVYKTTCLIDGLIYIGRQIGNKPNYLGSGKLLLEHIKKFGKENFTKEILIECSTNSKLRVWEKYFIKILKSQDPKIGLNIKPGGEYSGTLGKEVSIKTRKKLSKSGRGKKHTPEQNLAQSIRSMGAGNNMYQKYWPEERKRERTERITGEGNPFFNHHHSKETRKIISKVNKGSKWITNGKSNKFLKPGKPIPKGFWFGVTKKKSSRLIK